MEELRIALRQLGRRPALTAVIGITLALGIAANGIVFTWVRSVLIDTVPGARDAGRLAVLAPRHPDRGLMESMSIQDLRRLASDAGAFRGVTGSDMQMLSVRLQERTEWVWGQPTLANFFEVLGVVPVLGRGFTEGEDRPGAPAHVAVVSHRFWQTRLGGRADVLGHVIHVNERALTIVGVAPPAFHGSISGLAFDLWLPLGSVMTGEQLQALEVNGSWRSLHGIARLADGVSHSEAAARCETVAARLRAEFPDTHARITFEALPMWRSPWGGASFFLPALTALGVVGILLLLLVIANLANLQLVRAMSRESEMAVRMAVGASRWRIGRQLFLESVLLGLFGGGLGLLLSAPGAHLLKALMPPTYLPLALGLGVDFRLVACLTAASVGASLLFGLAPVRYAMNTRIHDSLKAQGRGMSSAGTHRLRQAFVITQVALAAALLVGMGLCLRNFAAAKRADLGFDPRQVWVAGFELPEATTDRATARAWYERLRREVSAMPGVKDVTLTHWLPLGFEGGDDTRFEVEGYTPPPGEGASAGFIVVGPNFCRTLGMRLIAGRDLSEGDDVEASRVVLVNEEFVRRYLSGRDALGAELKFWSGSARILGVVKNVPHRRLGSAPVPCVYLPHLQYPRLTMTLVVRTERAPESLRVEVDRLANGFSPAVMPTASMKLEDYVAPAYAISKVSAVMLSVLGGVALLLAALGLYAVLSQGVVQRRKEFGVRLALGAQPSGVAKLVLLQGMRVLLAGSVLGAFAAIGLGHVLKGVLVGVQSGDVRTWIAVYGVLGVTTLIACGLPAWRASRVDPMEALRNE